MPELPEVETMVRGIRSFVEGKRIVAFLRSPCRCRPLSLLPKLRTIQKRCEGQVISSARRRAKRIILELASGDAFVIEPRMTGLMLLTDPPDREHLRYEWQLAAPKTSSPKSSGPKSSGSVWFWDRRGLGTIRLFTAAELTEALGERFLGPDALTITVDEWRTRLARTSRPIKVALLDQKLVAGIGNLYASEILHRAGIHPARPADRLTKGRIERMAAAVRDILETAIRYEGSTLSDGTYRNALNEAGGYQNAHCVYDREHESCPTCQGPPIVRIVQAQRSTFYCRVCQK